MALEAHRESRPCAVCGAEFRATKRVRMCSKTCGYQASIIVRRRNWAHDRSTGKLKGWYIDNNGYKKIMVEPGVWRLEHRVVMEKEIGRPLTRREVVHHKNGDRADNRLSNLEVWVKGHPAGASHQHCATCTCFEDFKL